MEVLLRCALPDRPGALAALTGAIGEAGGDIQSVTVVETDGEVALDDLVVRVGAGGFTSLIQQLLSVSGLEVVHAGPSRGHAGDALNRLAVGLEGVLSGAMTLEHGVEVLVGGMLAAQSARLEMVDRSPPKDRRVLVLPFDHRMLVVRREYRFTDSERANAAAVVRLCREADVLLTANAHGRAAGSRA